MSKEQFARAFDAVKKTPENIGLINDLMMESARMMHDAGLDTCRECRDFCPDLLNKMQRGEL